MLAAVVDFELFRAELEAALKRSDRAKSGRPPDDAVLMFRVVVLQTLRTLSDDQAEYQLRDRLSFLRCAGLSLADPVPDAKMTWLFREQLVRAGAFERLFGNWPIRAAGRRRVVIRWRSSSRGEVVESWVRVVVDPALRMAGDDVLKDIGQIDVRV